MIKTEETFIEVEGYIDPKNINLPVRKYLIRNSEIVAVSDATNLYSNCKNATLIQTNFGMTLIITEDYESFKKRLNDTRARTISPSDHYDELSEIISHHVNHSKKVREYQKELLKKRKGKKYERFNK